MELAFAFQKLDANGMPYLIDSDVLIGQLKVLYPIWLQPERRASRW
jgi:hypothetical protein